MAWMMSKKPAAKSTDPRQRLGRWGEALAADHLQSQGYEILERNWRSRRGEIDLITRIGETIAFVEVKTRKGREFGLPEEGLTTQKANRLLGLAQEYLAQKEIYDINWRIDLFAVELDQNGNVLRCEHIPNAVLGW